MVKYYAIDHGRLVWFNNKHDRKVWVETDPEQHKSITGIEKERVFSRDSTDKQNLAKYESFVCKGGF